MARKDAAPAEALKEEVAKLKAAMPELEAAEKAARRALDNELAAIPNLPAADTPDGKDENDNVEVRRVGAPPRFPEGFKPKEHFEIGEALGPDGFRSGGQALGRALRRAEGRARAAGARADAVHARPAHAGARLSRRSIRRCWCATPPMFGTKQLPKFREDQFAAGDGYWLIPTAEVPMTNLVREQIVDEKQPAAALHRGHALLPRRSGRGGARHARHDPPAPVREGRTGLDHDARAVAPTSTSG